MSDVRAKFRVNQIQMSQGQRQIKNPDGTPKKNEQGYNVYEPCEQRTIIMQPVYGNGAPDSENARFWDATPSGELKLCTINEAAWSQFELGKEYYIDFTKAPKP